MSERDAELEAGFAAEELEPDDAATPDEYEPDEPGAESGDTGTHYDAYGEAETTPQDLDDSGGDEE